MKDTSTLVKDIYSVLEGKGGWDDAVSVHFGLSMDELMERRLNSTHPSGPGTLRMSNIGQPCERKLWYHVNGSTGEPLPASARMKFLYGDIMEEVLLSLAEAAGHKVEGKQDRLVVDGIVGHRDCVIDGMLVDVKTASTFGYKKFKQNGLKEDDPFGYIQQLAGYLLASQTDPLVTNKKEAAFLVIDKQHGHICLDVYNLEAEMADMSDTIARRKASMVTPVPPGRPYRDKPQSKTSPNRKLDIACSYCEYKKTCWPGVRTFIYSYGPEHLTKVVKTPSVPEIK